jgi:amino-acid N-acetyltransferase
MATSTAASTTNSRAIETSRPIEVECATAEDADEIAHLLRRNANVPTLVMQPLATILRNIDEFMVIRRPDGMVVGCAQLHWHQPRIAEVLAVAVQPERHGEGLGRVLVRACLERAMRHDPAPSLVWLVTRTPGFFARLGFRRIPVWEVPPSVLLGKLGLVLAQPPRRWLRTFGHAVFMRWAGAW